MSLPGGGVFAVIIGSKAGAKIDALRSASSVFTRLLEIANGLLQKRRVESGRHFPVGGAGAIDLLGQAARTFDDARVERIPLGEPLQILERRPLVERVRARLQDV